eukprot:SAG22_NODE_1120_length_5510_cov_43.537793_1_plen_102_part_10
MEYTLVPVWTQSLHFVHASPARTCVLQSGHGTVSTWLLQLLQRQCCSMRSLHSSGVSGLQLQPASGGAAGLHFVHASPARTCVLQSGHSTVSTWLLQLLQRQ